MSEHHGTGQDGIQGDDGRVDPTSLSPSPYQRLRQQELSAFREPVMVHSGNPHERLYVAGFDGTGNDKIRDPKHETNIGLITDQIENLNTQGSTRIVSGYVEGPGTQQELISRSLDGIRGYTVDERAERMYKMYIEQAWKWKREDPDAQIRVAGIGFSRGGEETALFARMVDERGIQDPSGAKYTYGAHHQIKHVEYAKPPLVAPGQVAQAVALFDPVGTGHAMHEDRRLPPSVISGIQFIATDEHRGLFKSDHIIDPGLTADGRFVGVYVPGAHSDVGGGYLLNGLSIRTGNLAIDYLNGLSDQPFLQKSREPDDPRLNVIHHPEDDLLLYRLGHKIDRLAPGGYNELEVPRRERGHVPDPYNAEPCNEVLNRQFARQAMPDGALPLSGESLTNATALRLGRMLAAADSGNWDTFRKDTQAFSSMDAGMTLRAGAVAGVDQQEHFAATQLATQQQVAQQQAMQQGPLMQGPHH